MERKNCEFSFVVWIVWGIFRRIFYKGGWLNGIGFEEEVWVTVEIMEYVYNSDF